MVSTEFEPRDRQELTDYYSDLLARHLLNPGEPTLQEAEQLGQSALKRSPSLREIAEVHHEALSAALAILESGKRERPAVFGGRAAGRESTVPGENPPALHAAARLFTSTIQPFEAKARQSEDAAEALRYQNWRLEEQAGKAAHAIHDDTLQLVAAAHLLLHEIAGEERAGHPGRLTELSASLEEIERRLAALSAELRPCVLDHLGLPAAADWIAKCFAAQTGIEIDLDASISAPLPNRLAVALYRAVQEALANVASHSRASRVRIRLTQSGQSISCAIVDNGIGFDAATVFNARGKRGLGLIGIRENIRSFGGTLSVRSALGGGAEVTMTVPLGTEETRPRTRHRATTAHGRRRSRA